MTQNPKDPLIKIGLARLLYLCYIEAIMSETKRPSQHFTRDKTFTANDVKKVTGLSYRQQRFWDSKGILPSNRTVPEGWRKFSFRDVFVTMICLEIHKNFKIPLEALSWIKKRMLQNNSNVLLHAINLITKHGFATYLMTDLKKTLLIDSDYEIQDLFESGVFRSERPQGYLFLKLNPLVNEMLRCLELPEVHISNKVYDEFNVFDRETKAQNQQELKVLRIIRDRSYQRVVVHKAKDQITQVDIEEVLSPENRANREKEIIKLLNEHDYQTLTLQVQNGELIRISRKEPIKIQRDVGKT